MYIHIFIKYKKPSVEKELAPKVFSSESGSPITTPILLEGSIFCLGTATALEEGRSGNWGTTF